MVFQQPNFTFHSSGAWKTKMKALAALVSDESLCLAGQTSSGWSLHGKKGWDSSLESLIRSLIPFMKISPSWHSHLPEAPPSNTITWGLGLLHTNLWGHTHSVCSNIWTLTIHNWVSTPLVQPASVHHPCPLMLYIFIGSWHRGHLCHYYPCTLSRLRISLSGRVSRGWHQPVLANTDMLSHLCAKLSKEWRILFWGPNSFVS